MMNATLVRYEFGSDYIRGFFVIAGILFHTIERQFLNNKKNKSSIPTGEYYCSFLKRSGSGKYRNVYHVKNVPDRSGILIHSGNLSSHSKGCIILGSRAGILGGKAAVLSSKTAIRKLNEIAPNGFGLTLC